MPRVYLIGGAPRVGKTNLALKLIHHRPMFAQSADSVRDMLQGVLVPTAVPDLFANHNLAQHESAMARFLKTHPQRGIEMQNDESAIVWPSVDVLIKSYLADGQSVIVEGVEILPHLVAKASYPVRAVFLGNTSEVHQNTIAEQAHANPHDWMHRYADGSVAAWAQLGRSYSRHIKTEAETYHLPYLETHDDNFEGSLNQALNLLLG